MTHEEWIKTNKDKLTAISNSFTNKNKVFFWMNKTPYSWKGALLGYRGNYECKTDLTADILFLWFDHKSGDTPSFFLKDAIDYMGDLWDDEIWRKLDAS